MLLSIVWHCRSLALIDVLLLFLWRLKVPEQLRTVDVAESEYIASILALNSYTTEFQPEMEAKLKQFQVREYRCSEMKFGLLLNVTTDFLRGILHV